MSDSIFSLNYLALCKSSPDFAAKITKYENAKEYSIQIDEGKETTLLIDGRRLPLTTTEWGLQNTSVKS